MIISTKDYSTLSMEDFDALLAANGGFTIAHNHHDYQSGYVVGGAHGFNEVTVPYMLGCSFTAAAEIAVRLNLGHDVGVWVETWTVLGQALYELVIDSVDIHTSQGAAMLCACSRGERAYYHIDTDAVIATYIN